MNRDEVRELAKRTGINMDAKDMDLLVMFATMVELQERERCYDLWKDLEIKDQSIIEQIHAAVLYERECCASLCETFEGVHRYVDDIAESIIEQIHAAVLYERECCASLCETFEGVHRYVDDIAEAIRARGNE